LSVGDSVPVNVPEAGDFIEEESWLRQTGETGPAFRAFCLYRDYGGDRSIVKAMEANGVPSGRSGIWCAWSRKYQWVRRCGDYDKHLEHLRRVAKENAFREREEAHLKVSKKMLEVIEKRLEGFKPEELSQGNLVDWLKTAVGVETTTFERELGERKSGDGAQLEISFFEDFRGV